MDNELLVEELLKKVPGLMDVFIKCPADDCSYTWTVYELVMHLNDDHRWSREAIADWLDTLDVDLTIYGY